jgi:hypothetical protein
MSSKLQRSAIMETETTSTQATASEVQVENATSDEEIRIRAYEIYVERGEQQGRELDDWLQAERELEARAL